MTSTQDIRLGADIGGTFTDIAVEVGGRLYSTKVLTTYAAPEQAILDGIGIVTAEAGITAADIDIVIHGTTLATNALIERRGARTAPRPGRQICLASANAVSAMRFEKPHSLSYQDRMRQKLPSITLVSGIAKIDECGSWLKSIETSLSSV